MKTANDCLSVTVLVDDPSSWIMVFAQKLVKKLKIQYEAVLVNNIEEIKSGDMLFLLGCTKILSKDILQRNKYNFVIHESALPCGRGWSPLNWQILEGKNTIPIVLCEAVERVDSGQIYLEDLIEFNGSELLPEIRQKQGEKTIELVLRLLAQWPHVNKKIQEGKPTYYRKRSKVDDQLDVQKSITEQFNHLRIVDNDRYPAWFEYKGHKFFIKIYPFDEKDQN